MEIGYEYWKEYFADKDLSVHEERKLIMEGNAEKLCAYVKIWHLHPCNEKWFYLYAPKEVIEAYEQAE